MKLLYFINRIFIFLAIVLGAYTYTTYYGFLGLGGAELEKFLVIPIFIVPVLIVTLIINIAIKKKLSLSITETIFPLYAIIALFVPILLNGYMDISIIMIAGNMLGLLLIIWFIVMNIKTASRNR
ncbi:MAG: hypothetical protein ACRC6T_00300 [Sarcina sp.]